LRKQRKVQILAGYTHLKMRKFDKKTMKKKLKLCKTKNINKLGGRKRIRVSRLFYACITTHVNVGRQRR